MKNEEIAIQETITALKKMSDVLYKDGYLWYSDVCDDAVNIIEKLIAENERLKFKHENNALTIEEKRWIPVSEKMPDYTDNYKEALIWTEGSLIMGRVAPEQESYTYMETVKKALEKQVPKKPIKESLADYLCPICLNYLSFDALNDDITTAPKFCEDCGQAIDWNEEVEE